jgi:hypothetical protein
MNPFARGKKRANENLYMHIARGRNMETARQTSIEASIYSFVSNPPSPESLNYSAAFGEYFAASSQVRCVDSCEGKRKN